MTQRFSVKDLNKLARSVRKTFEKHDEYLRRKEEKQKFRHRSLSGDARQKESVVRLIAQNADQMIIVASFIAPPLRTGLIDRFLMMAGLEKLTPIIVFNKIDLLEDRSEGESVVNLYRSLGYFTLVTSTKTGEGLEVLRDILKGHASLLAGHSGVGKSSLLNALEPDLADRPEVSDVSLYSKKGRHTTTTVKHYSLPGDTVLFDLPGIKIASFYDIEKVEIQEYFPEMATHARLCRYNDCLHGHEPGCAVKEAVERGEIDEERYASYLRILGNPFSMD